MRKFYITGDSTSPLCYTLDPAHKFMNVVEIGDAIIIVYEKKKEILDLKMKKMKEAKEK